MKYQLISSGRLLIGPKEKESIARIQRITQLSEEHVRKSLLNGTPKKLLSSDDKEKIKKAALALRQAGLEVTIKVRLPASAARTEGPGDIAPNKENVEKERIDSLPPSLARKKIASAKKKFRFRRLGCSLVFLLLLLFTLASGAIGYAWYWLYRPLPTGVAAAEQALFDGNLIMAGLVNVKKLTVLEQYWFGELDPKALPFDTQQQGLFNHLLSGAPKFRKNLTHILYSASTSTDQQQGTQLILLAGKFEEKSLLTQLLHDLGQVVQEGISSAFAGISGGNTNGGEELSKSTTTRQHTETSH
ncbi:MAG: hypothetical protein WBM35_14540 [Candidatus Electrothrix sp.]